MHHLPNMPWSWRWLSLLLIQCSQCASKIQIFILAGQSNMWGMASVEHLKEIARTKNSQYSYLMDKNLTAFRTRRDVRMIFNGQRGDVTDLAVGFGTNPNMKTFGPEIGFGWTVGDVISEPVLIIKVAWDFTYLAIDWKSPSMASAGRTDRTGRMWNILMDMVDEAKLNLASYFPGYVRQMGTSEWDVDEEAVIAGFCWLQGFSEVIDSEQRASYEKNLNFFVGDILTAFGADMPFLIGELGIGGDDLGDAASFVEPVLQIRSIQERVAKKFDSNVVFVSTHEYVVANGTKFDGTHHYDGRADTMIKIGNAFGEAMISQIETPLDCSAFRCGDSDGEIKWSVCRVDPVTKMTSQICDLKSNVVLSAASNGDYCGPCENTCAEEPLKNDPCDDAQYCTFNTTINFFYELPSNRNRNQTISNLMRRCEWLASQSKSVRDMYCLPGMAARNICFETCGMCKDTCEDDESLNIRVNVEMRTCKWLRNNPQLRDDVCSWNLDVWNGCKEYCGNCEGTMEFLHIDYAWPNGL